MNDGADEIDYDGTWSRMDHQPRYREITQASPFDQACTAAKYLGWALFVYVWVAGIAPPVIAAVIQLCKWVGNS